MDDQGQAFLVAIVDDKREIIEAVRATVDFELVGDSLGEIAENSINR